MRFGRRSRRRWLPSSWVALTPSEGVEVARLMPEAAIVPSHLEGWAHLTESRVEIDEAFARAGLSNRLRWPRAGTPITLI